MMVERKNGLIVNVSSSGGLRYLFNVAYGVGKAAVDRMAADCAVELKKDNVTMISLWPGPVKTEYMEENVLKDVPGNPQRFTSWI
jgi:dehydrogenase/reductase SDR family protein 1